MFSDNPRTKTIYAVLKLYCKSQACSDFHDLGFGNIFLGMTPNHEQQREKIDNLDFTKIYNFVH